jgi:transcriptional regulator with XRE-family HTH domain
MNKGEQRGAPSNNHHANIIGPRIRKLRYARGWSQSKLAVQLQLKGLDMGRDVVARIESRMHCVKDSQIPYFALALGVKVTDLFLGLNGFDGFDCFK